VNDLSIAERRCQLRCVATLVYMMRLAGGPDPMPLVRLLREAENLDPTEWIGYNSALQKARRVFDLLPALHQRKIIATFAALHDPRLLKGEPKVWDDAPGQDVEQR
jgi:hypothetical protein